MLKWGAMASGPARQSSLFTNTAAQSARLVTGYAISFALAPFMLARLGLDAFGLWAVTGALATYAGLADFGVTRALIRFVALWDARDEPERIREGFALGLLVVTGLGVLSTGLALALAPVAADALGVQRAGEMRTLLLASALILTAQGYAQVLEAIPQGLRRMIAPNVAAVVGNVLNGGFSAGALVLSGDLEVYAWANAIAAGLALLPALVALVRVWGAPRPLRPSRVVVREVAGYGLKNQVLWIATLVNFQTDKVVIGALVGLRAAGAYEIASRVVGALRGVAVLTLSAMIPTFTAALARTGRSAVAAHYSLYTRRSVSLAFPVFLLGCVSAPFLLPAWLGEVPARAEAILIAASLANLVDLTTGTASSLALAEGRATLVAGNAVFGAVANIALTVALAPIFGLWGVLAGTLVALTGATLVFFVRFHRAYRIPSAVLSRAVLPPLALATALALPFALVAIVAGAADGRGAAAGALVAVTLLYGLGYWAAASRAGFLPERLTLRRPRRAQPAR